MGVYLVDVKADDWVGEQDLVALSAAVNSEFSRRGLPAYARPPGVPLEHVDVVGFEEKLDRPTGTFVRLCGRHLGGTLSVDPIRWDVLIPVEFDGLITLPAPAPYSTIICSSSGLMAAMQALALEIELPAAVPIGTDLDITTWFVEVEAGDRTAPAGRWRRDLDESFYVALFLRGAEFSVRHSCPMRFI
jgi:hypothetical protein